MRAQIRGVTLHSAALPLVDPFDHACTGAPPVLGLPCHIIANCLALLMH
jgi:hypothetical protein